MRKIILLCSAGMSTSMLVKKMQEAAKAENYECEIAAYSMSEANKGKIEELCPGIPVDAIDMKLYGRMDGKGVVAVAKKMLGD